MRWSTRTTATAMVRLTILSARIWGGIFSLSSLILGSGENTVRFCPPLVIDEEQAEFAVKTLEELLSKEEAK